LQQAATASLSIDGGVLVAVFSDDELDLPHAHTVVGIACVLFAGEHLGVDRQAADSALARIVREAA
jgi:hypothetical protein